MKRKKISETIDNINPKYIDEATEYIPKAKTTSKSELPQIVQTVQKEPT